MSEPARPIADGRLDDLATRYLPERVAAGASRSRVTNMRSPLIRFCDHWGVKAPGDLREVVIDRWVASHKALTDRSRENERAVLRSFYRQLARGGVLNRTG